MEQKAKLLAIDTAPDAIAVLQFTADIDSSNARRESRCVASRLQNTLQSVQQFTTIVDTFVSSNPTVAALVWGSFKVTISVSDLICRHSMKSLLPKILTNSSGLCLVSSDILSLDP